MWQTRQRILGNDNVDTLISLVLSTCLFCLERCHPAFAKLQLFLPKIAVSCHHGHGELDTDKLGNLAECLFEVKGGVLQASRIRHALPFEVIHLYTYCAPLKFVAWFVS